MGISNLEQLKYKQLWIKNCHKIFHQRMCNQKRLWEPLRQWKQSTSFAHSTNHNAWKSRSINLGTDITENILLFSQSPSQNLSPPNTPNEGESLTQCTSERKGFSYTERESWKVMLRLVNLPYYHNNLYTDLRTVASTASTATIEDII